MAQVGFTRERVKEQSKLPVFNPKDKELVRAAILTPLEMRYVHTLTKPVVRNGKIVQEERTNTKSGEKYFVTKTDYVGRFICLGDEGTLEDDGLDPKNCPACKVAAEEPDKVKKPEERYAVALLIYPTASGSYDVEKPFSLRSLIWAFPQKTYNTLVQKLTGTFGDDHIKDHDMLLEVKSSQYRNYEISFAKDAAWQSTDRTKDYTEEALEGAPDAKKLASAIAMEMSAGQIQAKLSEVEKEYSKLRDEDDDIDPALARAERKGRLDNGLAGLKDDDEDGDDEPRSSRRSSRRDTEDDEAPRESRRKSSRPANQEKDDDGDDQDGETIDFSDLLSGLSS